MTQAIENFNELLKQERLEKEKSVASNDAYGGNILNLPNEMLLAILEFLPLCDLRNCALVCKKFRKFSFDSILWRRISLLGMKINIISLERILNRGVQSFSLSGSEICGQRSLIPSFFESERFESLQHLKICNTNFESDLFEYLLKLTPQLKSVVLTNASETIGNEILRVLLNLEFLESLAINGNLEIDHNILDVFTASKIYTNLRHFHLRTYEILDDGILKMFLENLLKLSPNIVSLEIDETIKIEYDTLKHILNMVHIEKLSVATNLSVVSNTHRKILSNHGTLDKLRELDFSIINFRILPQFFYRARNLECIRLESCFIPETVFIQIVNLKNLQLLFCWYCVFESFLETLDKFASLQIPLRSLRLQNCDGLNSNLLSKCLLSCSYLRFFYISNVDVNWVTFKSLLSLKYLETIYMVKLQLQNEGFNDSGNCKFSKLEYLYLEPAEMSEIGHVLPFCLNITFLCLDNCVITEYTIQCIKRMKNLEDLQLIRVGQDSVDNTSDSCCEVLSGLTHFVFSYLTFQTTPSVLEFLFPAVNCAQNILLEKFIITKPIYQYILNMKKLDTLALLNVSGVSSECIPELLENCSKLEKNRIMISI